MAMKAGMFSAGPQGLQAELPVLQHLPRGGSLGRVQLRSVPLDPAAVGSGGFPQHLLSDPEIGLRHQQLTAGDGDGVRPDIQPAGGGVSEGVSAICVT